MAVVRGGGYRGRRMTNEEIIAAVGHDRNFSELDLVRAQEVAAYLDARRAGRAPVSSLTGGSSRSDARPGLEPEDLEEAAARLKASDAEFGERMAEWLRILREAIDSFQGTETLPRAS
jgi:hypothetical protein